MNLRIILEPNSRGDFVFNPGESLKGTVELTLEAVKQIRGCYIAVTGEARIKVGVPSDGSSAAPYEGHELLLSKKTYLVGDETSETLELQPGTQTFDFSTPLPPNLPSSLDLPHGTIAYEVEAVVDVPFECGNESKIPFVVSRIDDLNDHSELAFAQTLDSACRFYCYCCSLGQLLMTVTVPHTGFAAGQSIPVRIQYANASSVWVNTTVIRLKSVTAYKCSKPREKVKVVEKAVAEVTRRGVMGHQSADLDYNIGIPMTAANSNGKFCDVLKVSYVLQVEGAVDQFHSNPRVEMPIVIGTVPVTVDTLTEREMTAVAAEFNRVNSEDDLPPTFEEALNMAKL